MGHLTEDQRYKAQSLANQLIDAFTWYDTPQGQDAWKAVYDALHELGEGVWNRRFSDRRQG